MTMINANELRIGNWVNDFGGNPVQVIRLTKDKQPLETPIPLTPEILEKAGFVNVRDVHWCVPVNEPSNSFEICVWSDHVSYTMANNFHLKIEPLHQLQNLYFALTGTELEINL